MGNSSGDKVDLREENLKVFKGEKLKQVFFQPRIEYWYEYNKKRNTLPEKYKKLTLLELFDELGVSIRYIGYYTGLDELIGTKHLKGIKVEQKEEKDKLYTVYTTPKGELIKEETRSTVTGGFFPTGFPVKTLADIEKLRYYFKHTTFYFRKENFEKAEKFFENRGEPQFFLPKSPYQTLAQVWMKFDDLVYALFDYPKKIEELMKVIDESYDSLYEGIVNSGVVKIINFGENIDHHIDPPQYFEKYCIPFYQKRCEQLKKAGIYTHIHIDGNFKLLLKYLKDLPFDGLEALTPLPQGDVTIEEMKEAIGDKILLDGIPAIFFLPNYPLEELEKCVDKLIKLFHPRLVLGASDELPPGGDIKRVRYIAERCKLGKN